MTPRGLVIDLFCGGGGASEGIEELGITVDIGVNHDPEAIRMHAVNHPETLHLLEDIFTVDLKKYVNGRKVALVWASPACTEFSSAKGAQPKDPQARVLAWAVYEHVKQIGAEVVIMENVPEFQSWGGLDENGRPLKKYQGAEYVRFMNAMHDIGYQYQTWELVAADYGAPTTRKRWYAVFRKDGQPIVYPEPTHSKKPTLFDDTERWVPCGNFIDWSETGESIFNRKKPLAEKTMRRIANGIRKFIIDSDNPYILTDEQAAAFLIQYHSETTKDPRGQSLDSPISTLDTSNRYGLVSTFITTYYGAEEGANSVNEPLRTITTKDRFSMVAAFLMRYYGDNDGGTVQAASLNDPLGTVTTRERFGLVTVAGKDYQIADIRLRMLKPEELKLMQGFPKTYVIDRDVNGKPISRKNQVAKIGNSVVPAVAKAIVKANCPYLILA